MQASTVSSDIGDTAGGDEAADERILPKIEEKPSQFGLKNNDKGNDPDRLDIFHEPGNTGHLQGLGNKADQQNENRPTNIRVAKVPRKNLYIWKKRKLTTPISRISIKRTGMYRESKRCKSVPCFSEFTIKD
jgi:hypothetical protein